MSWLDELKAKALGKVGKVGASVTTALNLPTIKSSGESLFASLQNLGGNPGGTWQWAKPAYASDTQTLDTNTGGSSGGGAGGDDNWVDPYKQTRGSFTGDTSTNTNDVDTLEGIANNQQQSAVQAILSRLQMMRDIANRNIDTARGVRDEIKGNIGTTYGSLRDTAQTQMNAALDRLRQEGISVQNLYGRAGGDARRAFESALTRNRMLNRAQGTLGSSFYTDAQTDTTNRAATAQYDLRSEEAAKLAGIETRTSETDKWFKQKAVEIDQEEAALLGQADRDYQQQVSAAQDMERSYGIDSEEQLQRAENEYASKLSQIEDYVRNQKTRFLWTVGQSAGSLGSAISGYDWQGGRLGDTLSNTSGLDRAKSITSNMVSNFQPGVNNIYSLDTPRETTDSAYIEQLRRLGLLRNVA
jgi:hypothetical protein